MIIVMMGHHAVFDRLVFDNFTHCLNTIRDTGGAANGDHVVIHFDKHGIGVTGPHQEYTFFDFLRFHLGWCGRGDLNQFQIFRYICILLDGLVDLGGFYIDVNIGLVIYKQLEGLAERNAVNSFIIGETVVDLAERRQYALTAA